MALRLVTDSWTHEPGVRVEGTRALDRSKVQAPGIARDESGRFRLFYTAVGPGRPYPECQGYILSAVSDDGIEFNVEPGIRVAPNPDVPHMSLRVLGPSITQCEDGRWRMYFEARGSADRPTVICSAVSDDMLDWTVEDGIRLESPGNLRAPRYVPLGDGRGRLYCCRDEPVPAAGEGAADPGGVASAVSADGVHFEFEPGYRLRQRNVDWEAAGLTAGDVIAPAAAGESWVMLYSAWQDVPPGTVVPPHPSDALDVGDAGLSVDFAKASIAVDMAGFRSRIFTAYSEDGLVWERGECVIDGGGHGAERLDSVHAEDMCVIRLGEGDYRMYYASCDSHGNWRVLSASSSS